MPTMNKKYSFNNQSNKPLIANTDKYTTYGTIEKASNDKQKCQVCQRYEQFINKHKTITKTK